MNTKSTERTVEKDWFAHAFDALYPVVYAHRTVEAATAESAFAIEQLRLCKSCSVLDLCCGNGRHMVHLLKHTPHVVGLDYSPDLLEIARKQLGTTGHLLRGDMRAIPFRGAFDALANFFTSFGYFCSESENLAVAQGIARALKPGGRFFVDYLNPAYLRAHLDPESLRVSGRFEIRERRWIDETTRRVNKITEVERDGAIINRSSESVRLYERSELLALLERAGLRMESCYGNYDGDPVREDTPRQIVVGTRL
ncbi:MAG: class I SAM-dependent methyltransferase [Candidatus Hydrogenedentes bacterium]|nr:class I SAM-dependent methyltransferase [Candidatus Hydrogenedentota bacterium]